MAGVQLKPFEVVGGEHPADTRAGQRRFFQYRYTLRLIDANEIGQDVSLPRLPITYKVQSRVAADATLAGRDFTYMMPGLTVRVLSQVPNDAFDIRDGSDVGLERIEGLQFRARLLDIGAIALGAAAALLAVLALVAHRRRGPPAPERRERSADAGSAGARGRRRRARSAWPARAAASGRPDLVGAGHAALRDRQRDRARTTRQRAAAGSRRGADRRPDRRALAAFPAGPAWRSRARPPRRTWRAR